MESTAVLLSVCTCRFQAALVLLVVRGVDRADHEFDHPQIRGQNLQFSARLQLVNTKSHMRM